MKRVIAVLICCSLILSGCQSSSKSSSSLSSSSQVNYSESATLSEISDYALESASDNTSASESVSEVTEPSKAYSGLDDPELEEDIENNVYSDLIDEMGDDYFIENVDTIYLSKEYIDDLESNSKSNIYFGYTLDELNQVFQGKRYVFTLGDNGETIVQELVEVTPDNTFSKIIRNVMIGTGVILVCVTVSALTYTAAPAVSLIFAASAKGGGISALGFGSVDFLTSTIVTYCETGDWSESLKAGALSGSEGFLYGAVIGAVTAGTGEYIKLKGATLNGLTMNEAAQIQRETKWPLDVIKRIQSMDEYNVYKNANLNLYTTDLSNGTKLLLRDVDWNYIDKDGLTNLQRIQKGLAPLDPEGHSYQLHHIGQNADSPLALLTESEHQKNYSILHNNSRSKNDPDWDNKRKEIWKLLAKLIG